VNDEARETVTGPDYLALLFAFLLSVLVCLIDVPRSAKTTSLRTVLHPWSLFYFLILLAGNTLATIAVGPSILEKLTALKRFYPYLAAAFGVFGFRGIISNLNVTIFQKNILTFDTWITAARNQAIAETIRRNVEAASDELYRNANAIAREVDEAQLNAAIAQEKGPEAVAILEKAAATAHADPKHYKSLELMKAYPGKARSILKAARLGRRAP